MPRSYLAISALALCCSAATSVQAQVKLEQKIQEGTRSTVVNTIETNQTLKIAGMDVDTASKQTRTVVSTSGARAADGTIRVKHEIQDLAASITMPGGVELEFDSKNADAPPPGTQFDIFLEILKATSQWKWTMVHDRDNRIVAVEGEKELLESLDAQARELVSKQFDADYLKEQANMQMNMLPSTPVAEGDTWERTATIRLEGGQNLEFTTEYKYMGTVRENASEFDKIAIHVQDVSYTVDDDAATLLRIVESDLKIADSEGYILFDRRIGQIKKVRDKVHITGKIRFSVNGNELPGELDLTMSNDTERT